MTNAEPLGLIAGNGRLPLQVAREARRAGLRVVAVALRGETLPEIDQAADEVAWVAVGALRELLDTFRQAGVRRVVLAGGLDKPRLLRDFRPDPAALQLLLTLKSREDDALLRALAGWLESEGVEVVDAAPLVPGLYAAQGVLTRRAPSAEEQEAMEHGWRVAKALGALDVGQTVAVKSGSTVAVEAVEGTDEVIRRAGRVAGPGVVVVKVAKPGQDLRFDVPTVGPGTIEAMAQVGATALGVEAASTLLLDRDDLTALADRHRIAVVGLVG
jgi:hypothetical protein